MDGCGEHPSTASMASLRARTSINIVLGSVPTPAFYELHGTGVAGEQFSLRYICKVSKQINLKSAHRAPPPQRHPLVIAN